MRVLISRQGEAFQVIREVPANDHLVVRHLNAEAVPTGRLRCLPAGDFAGPTAHTPARSGGAAPTPHQ